MLVGFIIKTWKMLVCFYYRTSNIKNSYGGNGKLFEPNNLDRSQKFLQFEDAKNLNKSN